MYKSYLFLSQKLGSKFDSAQYHKYLNDPEFKNYLLDDLKNIKTAEDGDAFFQEHANFIQGYHLNSYLGIGFYTWRILLRSIFELSPEDYKRVHKGTAYYHSAIFALKDRRPLYGLEMMDYALSEDIKTAGHSNTPAGFYLSLDHEKRGNDQGEQDQLMKIINPLIQQYNAEYGKKMSLGKLSKISKNYFLCKRSLSRRSAWCSFLALFLESYECLLNINIAPNHNEGQTRVKLMLTQLALTIETFIKFSPKRIKMRILNDDTFGSLMKKLNIYLYDPREDSRVYSAFKGFQKLEGVYEGYSTKTKKLLKSGSTIRHIDFGLAWSVRDNSNHVYNKSYVSERAYKFLIERMVFCAFRIFDELYC